MGSGYVITIFSRLHLGTLVGFWNIFTRLRDTPGRRMVDQHFFGVGRRALYLCIAGDGMHGKGIGQG